MDIEKEKYEIHMEKIEEEKINLKEEMKKIFTPNKTSIFFVLPLFIASIYFAIFETTNYYQMFSLITFSIFISFASIQDFHEKMVLEIFLIISGISSIFYINNHTLLDKSIANLDYFKELSYLFGINILTGLGIIVFIWILVKILSFILKKQAMGDGDFPIFFAMIIYCGFLTSYTLIIMSLSAIIYKLITKEETIPLIPFMQLGIVVVLFGEKYFQFISDLYLSYF